MATVTFKGATRIYPGSTKPALDKLDLEVRDQEFLVLVGPSGCGKSTCLRMIAGLEEVNEGAIFIGDRDVTNLAPKDRDIAMVFQSYALYPHMTVRENMAFAAAAGQDGQEGRSDRKVTEAAKVLDLTALLDRKPARPLRRAAPAGGHGPGDRAPTQGVPDGRAAVQPRRQAARADAHRRSPGCRSDLGTTTVYVTHDQTEAMTLGDRVVVIMGGRLSRSARPRSSTTTRPTSSSPGSSARRR